MVECQHLDSCNLSLKVSKLNVVVALNISGSGLNVTLVPVFFVLPDLTFLLKNLKITLKDLRNGKEREDVYHYEEGIKEFVSYVNEDLLLYHLKHL
jgi:DNA gyrase/topoisomerase IV subunit B